MLGILFNKAPVKHFTFVLSRCEGSSLSRPRDETVYRCQAVCTCVWDEVIFACESRRDFRRRQLSTGAAEGFTVNWLQLNTSFILLAAAQGRNLWAQSGGAVWFFFDALQLSKLPPSDENINYVLHSLLMWSSSSWRFDFWGGRVVVKMEECFHLSCYCSLPLQPSTCSVGRKIISQQKSL